MHRRKEIVKCKTGYSLNLRVFSVCSVGDYSYITSIKKQNAMSEIRKGTYSKYKYRGNHKSSLQYLLIAIDSLK